jgi:hypothetical protein
MLPELEFEELLLFVVELFVAVWAARGVARSATAARSRAFIRVSPCLR